MSVLQARAAGRRDAVLRRVVPREGRPNEAGARPGGGTAAAPSRRPQAVAMDPSRAERVHFKVDHPRGVDRYIE